MKKFYHKYRIEIKAGITVIVLIFLGWLFSGFQVPARNINPSKSYEESVASFEKIVASEKADPAMDPSCYSQLLTTGKKTENVAVMFVGFTNCPIQMEKLGRELQGKGYNVLILNSPHQGQKEKTNYDLGNITTKEIIDYGDTSVDIAAGLGEKQTVIGLSVGGIVSSWLGQNRAEVVKAVNIAPIYTPHYVPGILQNPTAHITNAMGNFYLWWDPKNKENKMGSPYAYNGFPMKALGKYTEVASMFHRDITKSNPKNVKTVVVLNRNDKSVNSVFAGRENLRASRINGQDVEMYVFAKEKNLNHDVIDPYNPEQNIAYTYPILVDLITN